MPQNQPRNVNILSRIARWFILRAYQINGWKIKGALPKNIKKYVIAGAPHTSGWDFVFFAGATHAENIQPNFMGKRALFRGPLRNLMLDMGGIPIDRSKNSNAVKQIAEEFAKRDQMALVIAAEGTRSSAGEWKSGFYHIAQTAGVPIVPAYADGENMIIGFGPPITPSGDYGADLMKIAKWLRAQLPQLERFKVLEVQAQRILEEETR